MKKIKLHHTENNNKSLEINSNENQAQSKIEETKNPLELTTNIPGEITSSDGEDELAMNKKLHFTTLDIFQDESITKDSNSAESFAEKEENLVEKFELDTNHNYNIYSYSSRFSF